MRQLQALRLRWNTLSAREKLGVSLAAFALGLAVLWWVLLAPALKTLRSADTEHRRLDTQLQHMQRLQAQAQVLKTQPRTNRDDAVRALEQSVKQQLGGGAQLNLGGNQATLTLKGVAASALAQWLVQARVNAHATLTEARLQRSALATPAAWDGTLVLGLPQN